MVKSKIIRKNILIFEREDGKKTAIARIGNDLYYVPETRRLKKGITLKEFVEQLEEVEK